MIANEFGKKIGGSKRDEWKIRGLSIEDLADMNDKEKAAYVIKDNVWPKIDCEAMKNNGTPITIIYFTKTLRDSISTKPCIGDVERYIRAIQTLKSLAESIVDEAEIDTFFKKCEASGFVTHSYGRTYAMTSLLKEIGGSRVFKAIAMDLRLCKYYIIKKKFMYTSEEKILSEYDFMVVTNPKEQFMPPYATKTDASYCMRKFRNGFSAVHNLPYQESQKLKAGSVLAIKDYEYTGIYNSIEEAKADILTKSLTSNEANTKEKKPRKKKFLYQQLEQLIQSNEREFLNGFSKTGEDYIEDFTFHGGEFGNWLSDRDRQKNLDMAYVSFKNLAIALNIPDSKISLGEKLSIAFGARGRGNAMAHYEPLRKVINLTKWRGAGSLAHEYGHAIDHILSEPYGFSDGFMSMPTYNNTYPEVAAVIKAMLQNSDGKRTKYYENSQLFDSMFSKDGGYWASTSEMFARAFACYVKDKLYALGIRDDYLCGHAESCAVLNDGRVIKAYPEGEERKRINEAIDQMLTRYLR